MRMEGDTVRGAGMGVEGYGIAWRFREKRQRQHVSVLYHTSSPCNSALQCRKPPMSSSRTSLKPGQGKEDEQKLRVVVQRTYPGHVSGEAEVPLTGQSLPVR